MDNKKLACKKPCKECPFRKESAPGYLGEVSYNPQAFLMQMEFQPIPCHLQVDWSDEEDVEMAADIAYTNPCIGSLQFLRNSCKLPWDKTYAEMQKAVNPNPNVFQWKHEFIQHHSKK